MNNGEKRKTSIGVKTASLVWILFGIVLVLGALLTAFLGPNNKPNTPIIISVVIAIGLGLLGVLFLYAGAKAFSGKTKGTLGNGIGAILFGVLWIGSNWHNETNLMAGLVMVASGIVFLVNHVKTRKTT